MSVQQEASMMTSESSSSQQSSTVVEKKTSVSSSSSSMSVQRKVSKQTMQEDLQVQATDNTNIETQEIRDAADGNLASDSSVAASTLESSEVMISQRKDSSQNNMGSSGQEPQSIIEQKTQSVRKVSQDGSTTMVQTSQSSSSSSSKTKKVIKKKVTTIKKEAEGVHLAAPQDEDQSPQAQEEEAEGNIAVVEIEEADDQAQSSQEEIQKASIVIEEQSEPLVEADAAADSEPIVTQPAEVSTTSVDVSSEQTGGQENKISKPREDHAIESNINGNKQETVKTVKKSRTISKKPAPGSSEVQTSEIQISQSDSQESSALPQNQEQAFQTKSDSKSMSVKKVTKKVTKKVIKTTVDQNVSSPDGTTVETVEDIEIVGGPDNATVKTTADQNLASSDGTTIEAVEEIEIVGGPDNADQEGSEPIIEEVCDEPEVEKDSQQTEIVEEIRISDSQAGDNDTEEHQSSIVIQPEEETGVTNNAQTTKVVTQKTTIKKKKISNGVSSPSEPISETNLQSTESAKNFMKQTSPEVVDEESIISSPRGTEENVSNITETTTVISVVQSNDDRNSQPEDRGPTKTQIKESQSTTVQTVKSTTIQKEQVIQGPDSKEKLLEPEEEKEIPQGRKLVPEGEKQVPVKQKPTPGERKPSVTGQQDEQTSLGDKEVIEVTKIDSPSSKEADDFKEEKQVNNFQETKAKDIKTDVTASADTPQDMEVDEDIPSTETKMDDQSATELLQTSNGHDTNESSPRMKGPQQPPKIVQHAKIIHESSSTIITVQFYSETKCKIRWFLNGKQVRESNLVNILTEKLDQNMVTRITFLVRMTSMFLS